MPYVLYGLSGSENTKVATFSSKFLAEQYTEWAETISSKKSNWGLGREYYEWSLLKNYDNHYIDLEENDEVPHDPKPTKEQKIE